MTSFIYVNGHKYEERKGARISTTKKPSLPVIHDFLLRTLFLNIVLVFSFLSMEWFPLFNILKDSNKRVVLSNGDLEGVTLVGCWF